MKIKKFIINLICLFIPFSKNRKKVRNKLMGENNLVSKIFNRFDGNKIILVKNDGSTIETTEVAGLRVDFGGQNSKIILHTPVCFENSYFKLGDDCEIFIAQNNKCIRNLTIATRKNNKIQIGKNFDCMGCCMEVHDESDTTIRIGDDCLFSYGIVLRPSDGHTIYEISTGRILNHPQKGITIGDHVWVGMQTKFLKDSGVANNSVVGAASLVTKTFTDENVIIGGSPAKILKHGINWDINNTDNFKDGYYDLEKC